MALSEAELRAEVGLTGERLRELVRAGIVEGDDGGRYAWHDIYRLRMVESYLASGIGIDQVAEALRRGLLTFDYIDQYFLEPARLSGRTFEEFSALLSDDPERIERLYETLGLPPPRASRPMRSDEEEVIAEFVQVWGRIGDQELVDRAARLIGENLRRAVNGWLALWVEEMVGAGDVRMVSRAPGGETEARAAFERQLELSHRLAELLPRALVWLEQRLLEQQLNATNVELFERGLAELGMGPPPQTDPPAVVFVDLAGFTRLTEELGDQAAVRYGGMLHDVASRVARRHGGRLVKLLGDGAMLHFPRADAAIAAVHELAHQPDGWPAELPPAHIGVHAGAVIERDGDYFGRTVNLAARLSGHARAGEVLVSADTVRAMATQGYRFEPLGPVELKNVPEPIEVTRLLPVSAIEPTVRRPIA